jgi:UDP-glucose 4-epimerase
MGTLNLFEYCKINKPKNIIFASSMAIYGLSSKNVSEKSIPMPISFYGLTKLNGEKILLKLKDYNINVKIFRIFNVYGVYQNYNNPHQGMLSIYLSQILRSSVVNVTGSLNRTRDFIYIDDVINALISHKILNYKLGNIFNLGSGKEISVHYLISTLFKITKKKYKVVIKDEHSGDTFNSCANISLIKKTNWKISFPLIKGINKVIKDIKYFDDNNCSFNR